MFSRDGSQEVIKPITTTQFKMENACIYNLIEFFYEKKIKIKGKDILTL